MEQEHDLPIWFFVGALLLAYGIIVLVASLRALEAATGLGRIVRQAGIAWGMVLIVFGGLFVAVFRWRGGTPPSR